MRGGRLLLLAILGLFVVAGCTTMGAPETLVTADTDLMAKPSLYERLGGQGAIAAVVETLLKRVVGDTRFNSYFAEADMPHLQEQLVAQLCQATGGPCTLQRPGYVDGACRGGRHPCGVLCSHARFVSHPGRLEGC